jgi:hypothetical protein
VKGDLFDWVAEYTLPAEQPLSNFVGQEKVMVTASG